MPAVSGAKHFRLFIDSHKPMTWVYFLEVKSHEETLEAFQVFKATEEKTSRHSICCFRFNNGRGEYDNRFFLDFLNAEGISYKPAAPYTENQNGMSKRKICTIGEWARTMLLEAGLPERFWGDAIAMMVQILNRSPTKGHRGRKLFEAWFGHWPNHAQLRRFGCNAFLNIPDAQRTQSKPKGCLCTFLGYVPNTTEQWQLWDGHEQKIVIGSNVRFHENGFGNRQPEDLKMLEEISEYQMDQLSLTATARAWPVVETIWRGAVTAGMMPDTSPPVSG